MAKPKDHYVPKSILKNFAKYKDKVYCLFKPNKKITTQPTSIQKLCCEKDFYSFPLNINDINDHQKVNYDHQVFTKIDSEIAPIIKNIIKKQTIIYLSEEEKKCLSSYTAHQFLRSPAIKNIAKNYSQNDEDKNFIFASNFLDYNYINSLSSILNDLNLHLIKKNQNNPFIISDSPVLLSPTADEIYFPISPECCLCYSKYEKIQPLDTICINELQFLASIKFNISQDKNVLNKINKKAHQTHIDQFCVQGQTSYWKCILRDKYFSLCYNNFLHEIYEPFCKILEKLSSINQEVIVKNIISIVNPSLNTNH